MPLSIIREVSLLLLKFIIKILCYLKNKLNLKNLKK